MIFDSHAHYDSERFQEDRQELLASLPGQGIGGVVNAAASPESLDKTLQLAQQYPYVYAALGIHPEHVGGLAEKDMENLRSLLHRERVVAVGEIGLDYYWDGPDRELQKYWFIRQLRLAREEGLPAVVHSRDAAADTLAILKEECREGLPVYIHCFSYSREMAREFLELGCMLGIGGVVTFQNARKIREAVEYIPLDRILLETDCPYLAPVPYRGKRNSSLYLPHVAEQIAAIRGLTEEQVEQITLENARRFFGI